MLNLRTTFLLVFLIAFLTSIILYLGFFKGVSPFSVGYKTTKTEIVKTKSTEVANLKKEESENLELSPIKLENPTEFKFKTTECLISDSFSYKRYEDRSYSDKPQPGLGYPNNKFGLYIYSTKDFIKVADDLVNSNGGDWGYVLIPYNVKDYDDSKWAQVFEYLSKKHLIPVIQLWDVDPDEYKFQTRAAARFLNKFAWPTKAKYISAYNEMNDSRFWKGQLDPETYSDVLAYTIETFKSFDEQFFVMNGAFNSTAPNGNGYMDQEAYMVRMNVRNPGIFDRLDGWASHPYPQPHYLGTPDDKGRGTIDGYDWELKLLKTRFELKKELPVFITETGWPHMEGESDNKAYYPADKVALYIKRAYEEVWLTDDRVVGVMPFTVFYDPPFDHFSWVKKDGEVYPQFNVIKELKKVAGRPPVLKEVEKEITICD